jgi:hypothetical protein
MRIQCFLSDDKCNETFIFVVLFNVVKTLSFNKETMMDL